MARPQRKSKEIAKDQDQVRYEQTQAVILAQEPPIPDEDANTGKFMPDTEWRILLSHLEARLMQLRAWRSSWWMQNWSDLSQFILPRRSIWLTQSAGGIPTPNNMTRGLEINSSIVDPTATFAVRVCTGGLVSGLASPSRPWFKITVPTQKVELDAAGRAWIDQTEERIYSVLALSNFYNSFSQECEDLVVFGTAPSIIYEDPVDIIHCYNPCVGEYYLGNDGTLRVNTFYRQFLMTILQMVDFFGLANCPPDVQRMWQEKGSALDQERIVAHAVEPNFGVADKGGAHHTAGVVPGHFAWREVYWVYGQSGYGPLSVRGFVDKPFTASRWATQSNDAYGRSPGMDVLPDVLQLQVETQRKAEAIEKQVRPPLVADMSLRNQPSSILPGHVTYVQSLGPQSGMRPIYEVQPDIKGMAEDIAQIQQRIQKGMFNDVFMAISNLPGDQRTATEINQRVAEAMQVLGPVIEGLLNVLKEKLKRIYGIMQRRGFIDEMPDSLKSQPLQIEFVSSLAVAQRAAATGSMERLVALIGSMAEVFPQVKDNLDADTYIRRMSDMLGDPQTILFGPEQVAATRQKQEQMQQQQHQMMMAQNAAKTGQMAADTGQTLSQTQVGAGATALSQLLGSPGNGAP